MVKANSLAPFALPSLAGVGKADAAFGQRIEVRRGVVARAVGAQPDPQGIHAPTGNQMARYKARGVVQQIPRNVLPN